MVSSFVNMLATVVRRGGLWDLRRVSLPLSESCFLISWMSGLADDPTGLAYFQTAPDLDGRSEQNDWNANPTAKEGQKVFHGTLAWAMRRDMEEAPRPLAAGWLRRQSA